MRSRHLRNILEKLHQNKFKHYVCIREGLINDHLAKAVKDASVLRLGHLGR
jgi:hypothetical protein